MGSVTVKGMHCEHCRQAVLAAVGAVPGVTAVTVDLAAGTVTWQGDASPQTVQAVKDAVDATGFVVG